MNSTTVHVPPGFKLIFRPRRRDPRTGEMIEARRYGKKVFPMLVPIDDFEN